MPPALALDPAQITGLVLAGGQGNRMGGVDKGLLPLHGQPLAWHALQRLAPQVGRACISANRHLDQYAGWGVPVYADAQADYPGPLAGFLSGLSHCETPWLLTVPCDTPLFPLDLAARLAEAAAREDAEIAMAAAPEEDGRVRAQPVFCLLRVELLESLNRFTHEGGRKIDRWTAQHRTALVPFDRADDDPRAFFNANTLAELRALEAR